MQQNNLYDMIGLAPSANRENLAPIRTGLERIGGEARNTESSNMSNSYVTHDQLREFGDKIEERFEKRFDKLDARMDRMDANIAKMSDGIVALTAKVDAIPTQIENAQLKTKEDLSEVIDSKFSRIDVKVDGLTDQIDDKFSRIDDKVDGLNSQIDTKLDSLRKEMKEDSRYKTTITIAGIALIVSLIQAAPLIIEAFSKTSQ